MHNYDALLVHVGLLDISAVKLQNETFKLQTATKCPHLATGSSAAMKQL